MKDFMRKCTTVATLVAFLTISLPGCYGGFKLTKKLYSWNGTVGGKFANTVVMWVFLIIPVYEIAGVVDFVILNLIEFWSGSNPVAMEEGQIESQTVEQDGKLYTLTATKNRFDILEHESGREVSLVFESNDGDVMVVTPEGRYRVAHVDLSNPANVILFHPDGEQITGGLN